MKSHIISFFNHLNNRIIACVSTALFLLSMLPIWYLARYARPSGDDYGYSGLTHAAWKGSHSLLEVGRAAVETVKRNYVGWNGDWFTTFLFSLMPEVFVPWSFWIVPLVMTAAVIAGTFFFMYEICVRVMKLPVRDMLIFTSLLLLAGYQFIPSTAIGMYWYVGATHYMLPHAAGLAGLACLSRFLRTRRLRYLIWLSLCAFMVGGSSYFTSILLFLMLPAAGILCWRRCGRRVLLLLIPFLICLTGFVIQCKSPGNAVRGGQEFGFSISLAVFVVFESLWNGLLTIGIWMREKTLAFLLLLVIALFGWESMYGVVEKTDRRFPFPLFFVGLMYGCYSAMFAPVLYSDGFDSIGVSRGPETIQYFTFLFAAAFSILYCEGWLAYRWKKKRGEALRSFMTDRYRLCVLFPALLLICLILVPGRGMLRDCVDKQVFDYVRSGQAEDFRAQIASQMEILLDDSVREAYLVPINPEQGPLMHMPVTADEDAFTNRVVREFYGKERVVMVEPGGTP